MRSPVAVVVAPGDTIEAPWKIFWPTDTVAEAPRELAAPKWIRCPATVADELEETVAAVSNTRTALAITALLGEIVALAR
jgi:hypothetical protein